MNIRNVKKMKPAVIFDMDGVIVDNGNYHKLAWGEFCNRHKISFSEEKFRTVFFGRTNEEVLPDLFRRRLTNKEIEEFGNEKEAVYREIYRPELKAAPGFIQFLNELKENDVPVGIATSAPKENVNFILQGLEIKNLIDVVVDDSMVSKGKPHPEIYIKTASLLKSSPENCVVFEDSLSGTQAAYNAGTKVVAVTTTLPAAEHKFAHRVIEDFREVEVKFVCSLLNETKRKA
jgi:beta-phosphoglucomutase